jgi:hypothetical protein
MSGIILQVFDVKPLPDDTYHQSGNNDYFIDSLPRKYPQTLIRQITSE